MMGSPPSTFESFGRIRVGETTSEDLLYILDKAIREADQQRRLAVSIEAEGLIRDYNHYMRRLRRVIRELERTRAEMGWEAIELSELARRT